MLWQIQLRVSLPQHEHTIHAFYLVGDNQMLTIALRVSRGAGPSADARRAPSPSWLDPRSPEA